MSEAVFIEFPDSEFENEIIESEEDTPVKEAPPLKEYLRQAQADGHPLGAGEIIEELNEWLDRTGCRAAVPPHLVEQYGLSVARWIQCEMQVSEHGLLTAHPTTKAAVASPYVSVAGTYLKQANQLLDMINKAIKGA